MAILFSGSIFVFLFSSTTGSAGFLGACLTAGAGSDFEMFSKSDFLAG